MKRFGPGYVKGWDAAESDLLKYGVDHVCNAAIVLTGSSDWFDIGYRSRAMLSVERRSA